MALDERVLRACQECAMRHIDDIEEALRAVKRRLKAPKLPEWISALVDNALREQIHFARHVSNRSLRRAHGAYGGPGKVGASSSLNDVAESVWQQNVFNHTICGWVLGDIEKGDLLGFAEIEEEKAAGSTFNAQLCRELATMCARKSGATVRECVSEKQVKGLFRKVWKQLGRDAA